MFTRRRLLGLLTLTSLPALAAIALLVLSETTASPATAQPLGPSIVRSLESPVGAIAPRRAISIPFIADGTSNTIAPGINPTVQLSPNGRHLEVTGHITCQGEHLRLEVTVTQASTGAEATGQTRTSCTGEQQTWSVQAITRGSTRFEPGPVEVCATATAQTGNSTDEFSWCRTAPTTLVSG